MIYTAGEAVVGEVNEIYQRGRIVDAWRHAEKYAPLKNWCGGKGGVIASRIAENLGAPRLATRLAVRAWRQHPQDPSARWQYTFEISRYRGPLAAWQAMRDWKLGPADGPEAHAEYYALKSRLAGDLRDFGTAEHFLRRADDTQTKLPWITLQRSHFFEQQDKVEEALETARAAMAMHPHPYYRPAVQSCSHLLQLLDRDEEAIQLLQAADGVLQNSAVAAQLHGLLSEHHRWQEAETVLARYVELAVLMEKPFRTWVKAQQSRAAYHLGRRADAAALLDGLDDNFHRTFAKNLAEAATPSERVQLDVSFVRQHFKTCAPATMAAIGRYWQMAAEHLKLAEAMCYDGTPSWQQREWAENHGWYVREFRVTHESVLTLINAGIPFAIATVEATSAHMQAIVGFDRVRGTILLRDPSQPYTVERIAEGFFKHYRPFGPHGAVYLPVGEKHRLDGVELPEAELYDQFHQCSLCLSKHDREGAVRVVEAMAEQHGDAALVWEARLRVAGYDGSVPEQVRCLDQLLAQFPGNASRLLHRAACLRDAPRQEQLDMLERACNEPAADPVLFIELARRLQDDARCLPQTRQWLKRAARARPVDVNVITVMADLLWEEEQFEQATELYRFAACLEGHREPLYRAWFVACRRTRQTDTAIAFLEDRFKRFGALSELPAQTLAWAWREMEQPQRAREVLNAAFALRPQDGYLLLRAAHLADYCSEPAEADRLLEAAQGKVKKTDWLRAATEIAERRRDTNASLQHAREILDVEPLSLTAHAAAARALNRLEGPAAAIAHLKAACTRFPHHYGLRRMIVDWTRNKDSKESEQAIRELLQVNPRDAWGRRELAIVLAHTGAKAEALAEAQEAIQIEPANTFGFSVLGHIHFISQQRTEARIHYRRAVELGVDNQNALHTLLELAGTDKERKEELAFIESQLIRQVVRGDGLLVYLDLARPVLPPAILLTSLQQAHKERPDLWHAWAALSSHLRHMQQLDEALAIADGAVKRFPHLPRLWLDLAAIHKWRKDAEAEINASRRAFDLNPAWSRSALALANALERNGKFPEAELVYERALKHSDQDSGLLAAQAHLLWREQKPEAALAAVEQALRLAPGYEWAWDLLSGWAEERGERQRAGNLARSLAQERPGEKPVWLMLARKVTGHENLPERLAAVERALALSPDEDDAWDLKAELLAIAERFDDAVKATEDGVRACRTDAYVLRGRRAWIEARRLRVPEAIRLMRGVLEENSSYGWGWHQLAHWLIDQKAYTEAASALEKLQQLQPRDAWVRRQLGLLQLKQKDRAAAIKSFAAALQIQPTDVQAAHNLFSLQLQAPDLPAATETLRIMKLHQPGTATQAAEISLQVRLGNQKIADEVLKQLCISTDPDPWPLDSAADAYERAGKSRTALKTFRRSIKQNGCNPGVAKAAIDLMLGHKSPLWATWFFLGLKPGEAQRRAAAPLVHGLAKSNSSLLFRWIYWRRRDVLAKDSQAWGKTGYALSHFRRMKEVAVWLADWRNRHDVEPWMLFNLCLALRDRGRYPEADAVARHAVATWGHRQGTADLRLFIAVEEALAGQVAAAQEQLQQVAIRKDVAYDQDLLAIAKALVEFLQVSEAERAKQFKVVRRDLGQRFHSKRLRRSMRDTRRTFHRAGKVFVAQGAGWWARWWFAIKFLF